MTLPKFLTTAELAESLQVTERTIINMRSEGTGPSFVVIGRSIRYPPRSVQEWLDSRKQGAPSRKSTPSPKRGPERKGARAK